MTKFKTLVAAMVIAGLMAASASVAQAGGGGLGGNDPLGRVFLTDCYQIVSSGNAPYTMDVTDQFGERKNITVGALQLVCVQSGPWSRQAGVNQPSLNPAFSPAGINAASCYNVIAPGDQGPGNSGTVVDLFGTQAAVLKHLSMLCIPANLE